MGDAVQLMSAEMRKKELLFNRCSGIQQIELAAVCLCYEKDFNEVVQVAPEYSWGFLTTVTSLESTVGGVGERTQRDPRRQCGQHQIKFQRWLRECVVQMSQRAALHEILTIATAVPICAKKSA
uniref:RUN domain-containing protein n=1 Tax=Ascaris lumbricoides TaxID=6252 RepID=A0A0M3HSB9_ASCLU